MDTLANGLPHAVVPLLEPWVVLWRAADPRFRPESLIAAGRGPAFRARDLQPAKLFYPPDEEQAPTFAILGARSPADRYELVFDSYQEISEFPDGRVEIGGEPDSSPLLIDLGASTANRFVFCGTDCGYEWGCWIDSLRFVLAGWTKAADDTVFQGTLSLYSLADSSESRFLTRGVSARPFMRYDAAWRSWVSVRYHAWKASRPRP